MASLVSTGLVLGTRRFQQELLDTQSSGEHIVDRDKRDATSDGNGVELDLEGAAPPSQHLVDGHLDLTLD